MKKEELLAIAQAAAKNIKTEHDLNELRSMLTKITIETALNAELDEHLGYDQHEITSTNNSRNGYTSKTLPPDCHQDPPSRLRLKMVINRVRVTLIGNINRGYNTFNVTLTPIIAQQGRLLARLVSNINAINRN